MIHQGKYLKEQADLKNINAYQLAPLLDITPPGVYKIFKRQKVNKVLYDHILTIIGSWKTPPYRSTKTPRVPELTGSDVITLQLALKEIEHLKARLSDKETQIDLLNRILKSK